MLADLAATHGFKFGTLDGGVDWLEPLVGSAGEFGPGTPVRGVSRTRERVAPGAYMASALPGSRAGPLLRFPVAKWVKSGASKSANRGN